MNRGQQTSSGIESDTKCISHYTSCFGFTSETACNYNCLQFYEGIQRCRDSSSSTLLWLGALDSLNCEACTDLKLCLLIMKETCSCDILSVWTENHSIAINISVLYSYGPCPNFVRKTGRPEWDFSLYSSAFLIDVGIMSKSKPRSLSVIYFSICHL